MTSLCLFGAFAPVLCAAAQAASFSLDSPTFRNGGAVPPLQIANRAGCNGANQSPPLVWSHAPAETQSYAVTMADLDAKVGVLWHWVIFDIPGNSLAIQQNADADAALRPVGAEQATNSFDQLGYSGACPPPGSIAHHYLITVWAMNEAKLPFKPGTPAERVAVYLRRHAIAHASLTPHYQRH